MNEPQRRKGLDPQLLYGISLLLALAMTWSSLQAAMRGDADIVAVGIQLLVTVAVLWTGGFLVSSLIGGYATQIPTEGDKAASTETPPNASLEPLRVKNEIIEDEVAA